MAWWYQAPKVYAQLPMKVKTVLPDHAVTNLFLTLRDDLPMFRAKILPKPEPGVRWGHRVLAECPQCGRWVPFGRMNQHWPTHE